MRSLKYDGNLIQVSYKVYKEYNLNGNLRNHAEKILSAVTRTKIVRDLIAEYHERTGLSGFAILDAHGTVNKWPWFWKDGKRDLSVQNWINRMDGDFLGIVIGCCFPYKNVRDSENGIFSRSSIVIHPKGFANLRDLSLLRKLNIYIPGRGYVR